MTSEVSPPVPTFPEVLRQGLGISLDGVYLLHLGVKVFPRAKVLVACHCRVGFAHITTLFLLLDLLQLVLKLGLEKL